MLLLTRLQNLMDIEHPNIEVGSEKYFDLDELPIIEEGEQFIIKDSKKILITSIVQEVNQFDNYIIFRTENLVYCLEICED